MTENVEAAAAAATTLRARLLASPGARPLRAFRHRTFTLIWSGSLVGQLGFWMSTVSFQWLVARDTHNDALQLGLLYFCMNFPFVLLAPVGGLLADRFDRQRVIVLAQYAIAAIGVGLAVLLELHAAPLAVLFCAACAIGCTLALYSPASQAVIANAVPSADLPSAVSLQSVGLNLARVAGPSLTTPILVLAGAAPSYAVYALTSLFVAWAIGRVRLRPVEQAQSRSVLRGIVEGFAHARERRPALTVLAMVSVTALFASSYVAMLAVFAFKVLDRGDGAFTALVTATGAGAVIGALAGGYREDAPRVRTAAAQMVAFALVLVGLALSAAAGLYPLAILFCAAAGGLNFAVMTGLNNILQFVVDEEKRGRVMSLYLLAWAGFLPLGSVPLGALSRAFGAPATEIAFAACAGVFGLAVFLRFRHQRRLDGAGQGAEVPAWPAPERE